MTQRCGSPIWALALCWFEITLLVLWSICFGRRFYQFLWILQHFCHFWSIWTKTRRSTYSIPFLPFCALIITLLCTLWEIQPGHEVKYIIFYEFTKVCNFYNFSSIRTKTRRCTPSKFALFYKLIITLQCIHLEIQPGLEVEYSLEVVSQIVKILSVSQFFIKSNKKHNVALLQLLIYPRVKFKKTFHWILSENIPLETRPDRQTDKLKPISPRFMGDN